MSRDIRSFFISKNSKPNTSSTSNSSPDVGNGSKVTKKRKQNIILDSSESEGDDDFVTTKKTKVTSQSPAKKVEDKKSKNLVPVSNVADILGSKPAKRSLLATLPEKEDASKKTKKLSLKDKDKTKVKTEVEVHSDSDFEATLEQLDELDEIEKLVLSTGKYTESSKTNGTKPNPESTKVSPQSSKIDSSKIQKSSPPKKSKYFAESATDKILADYNAMKANSSKFKETTPNKPAEEKKAPGSAKTPTSEKRRHGASSSASHNDSEGDFVEGTPDPLEKRKKHSESYKKYLQRSGPAHPGSKDIPEGVPNCLQGLVFVVTGVLDSLDREQVAELIKKYGGKATSSVSKNTTYLVKGTDAGLSKLDKAEKLKTPIIDEDGLLELIRTRQPFSGTPSPVQKAKKPKLTDFAEKSPPKTEKLAAKKDDNKSPKTVKTETLSPPKHSQTSPKPSQPTPKPSQATSKPSETTPKQIKKESFYGGTTSSTSSPSTQSTQSSQSPRVASSSSSVAGGNSQNTQPVSPVLALSQAGSSMWVDKYKPTSLKNIIGQQGDRSNAKKLMIWLESWSKNNATGGAKKPKPAPWVKNDDGAAFKAVLLSGPPGIGKTTTAQLVCRELGFDIVEFNASDTRSKKLLHDEVRELLNNQSLAGFYQGGKTAVSEKRVLLMEEVDGITGSNDRGGIQELIALIKLSRIPIICTCNDRNSQKLRSFVNHCFDLRFPKPRVDQIKAAMLSLCFKEGVKIPGDALAAIIEGTNHDIRQVIHHLSLWSAGQTNMGSDLAKREAHKSRKEIKLGPWDVVRKVFSDEDQKGTNINERASLFFHDYSIGPLFVQENYLAVVPHTKETGREGQRRRLQLVADAADCIATGDLVDNALRSHNAWGLLPTQAVFASVAPGTIMRGHMSTQIRFPSWLGKNSRRAKFDRLYSELQMHMRLSISGSKEAVALDYLPAVRGKVLNAIIERGQEGISEAMETMDQYHLIREDLESMSELCQWGVGVVDPWAKVDSKVKAAFTRAYNKAAPMIPYSIQGVGVSGGRRRGTGGDSEEGLEGLEGEEGEEGAEGSDEEDDSDDLKNDAMIKQAKKPSAKAAATSKTAAAGKASTSKAPAKPRGGKAKK